MKVNLKRLLLAFIVLLLLVGTAFAGGILKVHPTNKRYFTDDSGKAIYLTGSHTWYNIHGSPTPTDADFEKFLDFLQSYGHNFARLWTGWGNNNPKPWLKANGKYDLTKLDQKYFDTVRRRVVAIRDRGMYCSIMFFGSAINFHKSISGWEGMAWHPKNNINNPSWSTTDGTTFFTNTDSKSVEFQQLFIRKFIDTLHDLDNVLWEIANEAGSSSRSWNNRMAEYARSYEKSKYGTTHLVGITGGYNYGTSMLTSPADWVSPDWSEYKEGGPASYAGKIIISDTDHLPRWGSVDSSEVADAERWVWKAFTRGTHPIFMESKTTDVWFDPMHNGIRGRLGQTLVYANKMDLAKAIPSLTSSDCSTRYCLRNPGKEYLVYQPSSGSSFTVNLSAGTYNYEWLNPKTGKVEKTGVITVSSGSKSFTAPFNGDAVLYLKAETGSDTVSPTPPVGLTGIKMEIVIGSW